MGAKDEDSFLAQRLHEAARCLLHSPVYDNSISSWGKLKHYQSTRRGNVTKKLNRRLRAIGRVLIAEEEEAELSSSSDEDEERQDAMWNNNDDDAEPLYTDDDFGITNGNDGDNAVLSGGAQVVSDVGEAAVDIGAAAAGRLVDIADDVESELSEQLSQAEDEVVRRCGRCRRRCGAWFPCCRRCCACCRAPAASGSQGASKEPAPAVNRMKQKNAAAVASGTTKIQEEQRLKEQLAKLPPSLWPDKPFTVTGYTISSENMHKSGWRVLVNKRRQILEAARAKLGAASKVVQRMELSFRQLLSAQKATAQLRRSSSKPDAMARLSGAGAGAGAGAGVSAPGGESNASPHAFMDDTERFGIITVSAVGPTGDNYQAEFFVYSMERDRGGMQPDDYPGLCDPNTPGTALPERFYRICRVRLSDRGKPRFHRDCVV